MKMRINKDWNGNVLTLSFVNYDDDGKPIGPACDPVVFDRSKASSVARDRAEMHGWEQKHGDCAAIPRDTKSGKSATVEDKRAAVVESVERFETGTVDWTLKGGRKPLTPEQELALLNELAAKLGKTIS